MTLQYPLHICFSSVQHTLPIFNLIADIIYLAYIMYINKLYIFLLCMYNIYLKYMYGLSVCTLYMVIYND